MSAWKVPASQLAQVDALSWSVYVPGAHRVGVVEPVAQAKPTGHAVQLSACARPGVLEYDPAGHGNSADAPGGQKLPDVQASQVVDPIWSWYSPPLHRVHSDRRLVADMVPGAHRIGAVEPITQAKPTGHAVQLSACARPGVLEYDPAGHGNSADAPGGQYLPREHMVHTLAPSSPWYVPGAHLVHASRRESLLNVPGEHNVCAIEPGAHAEPAGQAVQLSACVRLAALEKLPARHGSSADDPEGQKLPGEQLLHTVAPGWS